MNNNGSSSTDAVHESPAEGGAGVQQWSRDELQPRGKIYSDAKAADRVRTKLDSSTRKPRSHSRNYRVRFEDLLAKSEYLDLPDREKIIIIQRGLGRDFEPSRVCTALIVQE
ncbi:hypothetical protein E4U30_005593 [Claviceps sp. LM220 group G6]|nr:hypothetical protein E4U30_005593 [Claviceps sp. LM220 group G6]